MSTYCANCGTEVHEGARFCTSCGKPVSQEARSQEAPPQASLNQQQASTSPPRQQFYGRTMLRAAPQGLLLRKYTVFDGQNPVASVDLPVYSGSDPGVITIGEVAYRARNEKGGWLGGSNQIILTRGQEIFARIRPSDGRQRGTLVEHGTKHHILQSSGWLSLEYSINEDDRVVGTISRKSFFSREFLADLPEELPLAVGVFMILFVIHQWKKSGSGGSGN